MFGTLELLLIKVVDCLYFKYDSNVKSMIIALKKQFSPKCLRNTIRLIKKKYPLNNY